MILVGMSHRLEIDIISITCIAGSIIFVLPNDLALFITFNETIT